MNPDTKRFEKLSEQLKEQYKRVDEDKWVEPMKSTLVRPDGSPVPEHWPIFTLEEKVVIKNFTFQVKYIGETSILLEPVGPLLVGGDEG